MQDIINKILWGVINEDGISFRTPRGIDSDECNSFIEAFQAAEEMMKDGTNKMSIVRCRYSPKDDCWVEVYDYGCIQIEAGNWAEKNYDD